MTFLGGELRRGMDVFDANGVYLGTVVHVARSRAERTKLRTADASSIPAQGLPFSGEALGPMPTAALGNSGPSRQSLLTHYASERPATASDREPTALYVVRLLVALDWTTLRPAVRRIPVRLIQNVSLERIVLSRLAADLY